ncbi:MAG: helix-turn-helix transcriptional regulator [Spirochaetes bacterium]|nr:helix-turn-helix transcriptional regulator [Spirochaetota bacterium]
MTTAPLLSPYRLYPRQPGLSWKERIVKRDDAFTFAEHERSSILPIYNCYRNTREIPAHYHRFLEISLILSGKGTAFIDDRTTPLAPGTLLFINHLQRHAEVFRSARVEKMILAILPSVVESGLSLSMSNGLFRAFSLTEPFFRTAAINAVSLDAHALTRVARSWCGLLHAYNAGAPDDAVIAHTRSLLEFIVDEYGTRTTGRRTPESVIAPALYHLRMNLKQPDIAAAIASTGLSKSHFYKVFGKEIGMPLGKYLIKMRLEKAVTLLRSTTLPVVYIAADLGFYDESHFHHALKRETGSGAAFYRNKNVVQSDKTRVPGQKTPR